MGSVGQSVAGGQRGEPIRLPGYRVLRVIAHGGMSDVYLARRRGTSGAPRPVVIKRLRPQLRNDPEFMKMFLDEVQIAVRLCHPNVVRVIEPLLVGSEVLLVLELVRGLPLSTILRRSRYYAHLLPAGVVASIGGQIAAGLHHAHELRDGDGNPMQIVHRDVSPHNIVISNRGVAKIIDFGVARALGRVSYTSAGITKGKPPYMAPEQLGHGPLDRRTDLFALGIVLWEALTGRDLFPTVKRGASPRTGRSDDIIAPSFLRPIPAELSAIVMRALERDPRRRFQDAKEMEMALWRVAAAERTRPPQVADYLHDLYGKSVRPREASEADTAVTVVLRPPAAAPPAEPAQESSLSVTPATTPLPSLLRRDGGLAGRLWRSAIRIGGVVAVSSVGLVMAAVMVFGFADGRLPAQAAGGLASADSAAPLAAAVAPASSPAPPAPPAPPASSPVGAAGGRLNDPPSPSPLPPPPRPESSSIEVVPIDPPAGPSMVAAGAANRRPSIGATQRTAARGGSTARHLERLHPGQRRRSRAAPAIGDRDPAGAPLTSNRPRPPGGRFALRKPAASRAPSP
jgi:serine/threonine-protein kinase